MPAHGPLPDAAVAARTRAECVRLLYSIAHGIGAVDLVIVALVLVRLWPSQNAFLLSLWAALMALLALRTAALVDRYRARAPPPARARAWEWRLALACALHGVGWGALGLVTLPPQPAAEHFFILLLLGSIGLAAAGTLTPSRSAFLGFVLPAGALIGLSVVLAGAADRVPGALATLGLLALLIPLQRLFHRKLVLALARRFESEALAHEQQIIFDTASEAVAFIRDERIVKCNRRFAELVGAQPDELLGAPARTWFPSRAAWEHAAAQAHPVIRSGATYRAVIELARRDGRRIPCEISGTAVDPLRAELGSVWMGRDIGARLETEAALRNSEQRFRDLLSLSSDWYWEQDRDFRFSGASGSVPQHGGIALDHVIGKRRWEIEHIGGVSAEQWQAHRTALERHQPFRDFTYQIAPPDAQPRWFSVSGKPVFDGQGQFIGYHGVGTDITERVRSAERYRHLAHHDMLTGLPNRRLLADRLDQAIALARRSGSRVALMLLDLDDFKAINDSQGHSVGDQVLINVGQRLKNAVRESDTVARLGGDEFILLLQDSGQPRNIARIADKIVGSLREPVTIGDAHYRVGASIGIALYPDHGEDGERLMQQADIAMYEAKRGGGAAYQFSSAGMPGAQEQLPLMEQSPTRAHPTPVVAVPASPALP